MNIFILKIGYPRFNSFRTESILKASKCQQTDNSCKAFKKTLRVTPPQFNSVSLKSAF